MLLITGRGGHWSADMAGIYTSLKDKYLLFKLHSAWESATVCTSVGVTRTVQFTFSVILIESISIKLNQKYILFSVRWN